MLEDTGGGVRFFRRKSEVQVGRGWNLLSMLFLRPNKMMIHFFFFFLYQYTREVFPDADDDDDGYADDGDSDDDGDHIRSTK